MRPSRALLARQSANGEAGQVIGAIPLLCATVALAVLIVVRSSTASSDVARADTAADAVALAVAGGGIPAGVRVAREHGATIVSIDRRGTAVDVVIRLRGVTGRAAAERIERWVPDR